MNIRKLTALVLAMALLAIPVLSLGESAPASFLDQAYEAGRAIKTTVTFTPGKAMDQYSNSAMIADLLKVLRVEASEQKQGEDTLSHIALFLQDTPSLSATFLTKADELHVMSNLLGGQVLSFTPEELAALYIRLLAGTMEDAPALDADMLDSLRSSIMLSKDTLKEDASFIETLGFDPVSFQTNLAEPLAAWVSGIMSNPKITTGVFEREKHDAAVTKKEHTVSAEQLKKAIQIFTNWAVKDENLTVLNDLASSSATKAGDDPYDKEEVRRMLLLLPDEFAKAAGDFLPNPVIVTELMDAKGERKALEIRADIVETTTSTLVCGQYIKTEADSVKTLYGLYILSDALGASISFTTKDVPPAKKGGATITESHWEYAHDMMRRGIGLDMIIVTFDRRTSTGASSVQDDWKLGFEMSTTGLDVDLDLVGTEKIVRDSIDAKAEGTVDLYLMGGSDPVCTIAYTTASYEPAALPVIPEDSVRLGNMTTEELEAWGQEAYPVAMGQLMMAMSQLPPSILNMIFQNANP